MSDFREAFAQGQMAFRDAERAQTEICALLDEFAADVQEASGGKLVVRREKRPTRGARGMLEVRASGGPQLVYDSTYDALVVAPANVPDEQGQEICRYELAEAGYPVTLRYSRTEERCHDVVALKEGLKRLLASPTTGRLLAQVMERTKAA